MPIQGPAHSHWRPAVHKALRFHRRLDRIRMSLESTCGARRGGAVLAVLFNALSGSARRLTVWEQVIAVTVQYVGVVRAWQPPQLSSLAYRRCVDRQSQCHEAAIVAPQLTATAGRDVQSGPCVGGQMSFLADGNPSPRLRSIGITNSQSRSDHFAHVMDASFDSSSAWYCSHES